MKAKAICSIVNERGIHARSAARFVSKVADYNCSVVVTCDDKQADGASLIEMMMLAAGEGKQLLIEAEGPDAKQAVEALAALVNAGFGE